MTTAISVDTMRARAQMAEDLHEVLAAHDPQEVMAAFDALPASAPYHFVPASVAQTWSRIEAVFGLRAVGLYNREVMFRFMDQFSDRVSGVTFTDEVVGLFERSFKRIVDYAVHGEDDHYARRDDVFLKDFALCRQAIFPAGAQVVDLDTGFHRSMAVSGGLGQTLKVLKLLATSGGHDHWFQIHTHLAELEEFNPDGWDLCYLRIADMLAANPGIRGMWGASWFYDPALEVVSPRLTYLRRVPQENGAYILFSHGETKSGALEKSKSRRAAFERGEYQPKAYAMIWPRREMLAWAARLRDGRSTSG